MYYKLAQAKLNDEKYIYAKEFSNYRCFFSSQVPISVCKNIHLYEVLHTDRSRLFLDIDFKHEDEPDVIRCIKENLTSMCKYFFNVHPTLNIASASNDTKGSLHVVVVDVCFGKMNELASFVHALKERMPNKYAEFIDMNVYKNNQNWRCINQTKYNCTRVLKIIEGSENHVDHMIGVYDDCSPVNFSMNKTIHSESSWDVVCHLDTNLDARPDFECKDVLSYYLSCIPNHDNGQPWIPWISVGFALKNMHVDVGYWIEWSNKWKYHDQSDTCTKIWNTMKINKTE